MMEKLIVSPCKLEQFRLHYTDAFGGSVTLENVIENVKGLTKWKDEMTWGAAIHAILEHGPERFRQGNSLVVKQDDIPGEIIIPIEAAQPLVEHRERYPDMIQEVKARRWITINTRTGNQYSVLINSRVDGLNGLEIHEHKTSKRQFKIEKYSDSCQWRIYLWLTGAVSCQYNTFQIVDRKKQPLRLVPFSFRFDAYDGLDQYVHKWVTHFVEFCERHDLVADIKSKY